MSVYLANVPFEDTGRLKYRPALVIIPRIHSSSYTGVLKITTKYATKSNAVKKTYYPLKNWYDEGLSAQSYVDIHKVYSIPTAQIRAKKPIGKLTVDDIQGLYDFVSNS